MTVSAARLRPLSDRGVNEGGDYVLYWMVAFRRTRANHALEFAVETARRLGRPLVVFEPLRIGYPGACDRFHRFLLDGMAANRRALAHAPALYFPYVEPRVRGRQGAARSARARARAWW